MTRFVKIGINNINQNQEQKVRPSLMDQYFGAIPFSHEIRFFLTGERYTNRQQSKRFTYQILSDTRDV